MWVPLYRCFYMFYRSPEHPVLFHSSWPPEPLWNTWMIIARCTDWEIVPNKVTWPGCSCNLIKWAASIDHFLFISSRHTHIIILSCCPCNRKKHNWIGWSYKCHRSFPTEHTTSVLQAFSDVRVSPTLISAAFKSISSHSQLKVGRSATPPQK